MNASVIRRKFSGDRLPAMPAIWTHANEYAQTQRCEVPNALRGFTLLELLVVIGIISIVAALLLPALAKGKSQARQITCLHNLKQLQTGWLMYVHDNNDALPPNNSERIGWVQTGVSNAWGNSWVWGNAKADTNSANIEHGVLFPEIGSTAVYHCPADTSTVTGHADLRRFRSYSASWCFNAHIKSGDLQEGLNDYSLNLRKTSQIVKPPAVKTLVFIDEHEQSIGDGIFGTTAREFTWFKDGAPAYTTRTVPWWGGSMPADRHSLGANISFADGHAEYYHWLSPKKGMSEGSIQLTTNPQDLKDLDRLQDLNPTP